MSKRRWLQIHLSTAIVLMFAASGLLALNTVGWRERLPDAFAESEGVIIRDVYRRVSGWPARLDFEIEIPAPFVRNAKVRLVDRGGADSSHDADMDFWRRNQKAEILMCSGMARIGQRSQVWEEYALNSAVALAMLAAISFSCEWLIRRRERVP